MRLFVSYSRRDAAVVRPIVEALEGQGHDVWIDTDDIRGSDRWRTVVAEAIQESDAVLLLISPNAMSSSSVEREMAVAAEDALRIVPVLIEPAPLSDAFKYDLAGVQHVSFLDRPFPEAMADLEAALVVDPADEPAAPESPARGLEPPPAQRPAPPAPPPPASSPQRPGDRRRRAVYGLVAVGVIVAAVVLVLQFGSGDDTEDDAVSADSVAAPGTVATAATHADTTAVADAAAPGDALTEATFDTTVWFSGFSIQATHAAYDEATGDLAVDVVFTNDQPSVADPRSWVIGPAPLVVDGSRYPLFCSLCTRLQPGTATRAVLDASIGGPVDLRDATIEFGTTDEHQAIVPLDGSPGTGDPPTRRALDATLVDPGGLTFTVERVDVVPAACSGLASALTYTPGRADEMSVVVVGTAVNGSTSPMPLGDAILTLPDGRDIPSSSLSGNMYALSTGQPQHDVPACFAVTPPVSGDYLFTVAPTGSTTFPDPITIAF